MARCVALFAVVLAACSGKKTEPPPAPVKVIDAGVPIDGITDIGANDPDRYLDPDPAHRGGQTPKRKVPARPIDVILKSTPPGAIVSVDNNKIGRTPTYWYGDADGQDHEFTFTLPGYALGRYRFVPIQSGTVHARLEPVSVEPLIDAGVADPVTVPPGSTPQITPANPGPLGPVDSPRPPDTVLSPGSGSAPGTPGSAGSSGIPAGSSTPGSAGGSRIGPQP